MNLFIEKHQQLLNALLLNNVDFIIIGGYSVIFHGYARTTGDVDIWLRPTNENKEKLLIALTQMDFYEDDVREIALIDFTESVVFSAWDEPEKLDFLTHINLVKYEEADKRKIVANIENMQIPFLHLHDLVKSKFNTGRLKDQADIEQLQKIQSQKKDRH